MTKPEHPGNVLWRMMREHGWNQEQLAAAAGVRASTVQDILGWNRPITLYLAVKLGHAFGTSAERWLTLQRAWEDGQP